MAKRAQTRRGIPTNAGRDAGRDAQNNGGGRGRRPKSVDEYIREDLGQDGDDNDSSEFYHTLQEEIKDVPQEYFEDGRGRRGGNRGTNYNTGGNYDSYRAGNYSGNDGGSYRISNANFSNRGRGGSRAQTVINNFQRAAQDLINLVNNED